MHLQRQTWNRLAELIRANEQLEGTVSYFWEFLFETYSKTQATAVRRQADTDDQAASLGRVMLEMSETPEILTREFWLGEWSFDDDDAYWRQEAEKQWTENFGGGDHIDPAAPVAARRTKRPASCGRNFVDREVPTSSPGVRGLALGRRRIRVTKPFVISFEPTLQLAAFHAAGRDANRFLDASRHS